MNQRYKLQNPKDIEEKIKNVTDGLGMPLDEGVFRSVVILNSLGLKTRQSCEGHVDRYSTSPLDRFNL